MDENRYHEIAHNIEALSDSLNPTGMVGVTITPEFILDLFDDMLAPEDIAKLRYYLANFYSEDRGRKWKATDTKEMSNPDSWVDYE